MSDALPNNGWMYCRRCGIDGRPPEHDKEWNCSECFTLNDAPAIPCDNPICKRTNCVQARQRSLETTPAKGTS